MSEITEVGDDKQKPMPAAVLKVLDVENRCDSGLADSREFSPDVKIVKFSPLVRSREFECSKLNDNSTDENELSLLSEPENHPMQSSGVNEQAMAAPDISSIEKGIKSLSLMICILESRL